MSLDTDLRTEIIAASTALLGTRVHQNVVPEQQVRLFPRVYFARTQTEDAVELDATKQGVLDLLYAVEAISTNLADTITVADAIRNRLNGKLGTFGSSSILGCLVDDQADDYLPRGTGEDAGLHVTALRVRVVST